MPLTRLKSSDAAAIRADSLTQPLSRVASSQRLPRVSWNLSGGPCLTAPMGYVLGVRQDTTRKGTTVTNKYQKLPRGRTQRVNSQVGGPTVSVA